MPTVSLDTVYRTLWMLDRLGLVAAIGPRRGSVRFDAKLERHHHYVCVRCGSMRDFESPALDALRIPAPAKGFGTIIAAQVELRGVCDRCAKEKPERPVPTTPTPPHGRRRRTP